MSKQTTSIQKSSPFRVVSFFTQDNEYAEYAKRLIDSLDRFGIEHDIIAVRSLGAWEFDCARKAEIVRDAWRRSEVPIVWIDADATMEAFPSLFQEIDADFAIHRWDGWQFGSGTIYFNKTQAAELLIDQWVLRCHADPNTWDQVHLQSAWCDVAAQGALRTAWLPRSYLQINGAPADESPVILHWQASRQLKADGRVSGQPTLEATERGRALRATGLPWRDPEQAFWISEGTAHIKPEIGYEYPEGFDVGQVLRQAIAGHYPLLEVGCGVGRVAALFSPTEYVGVDINPNALLDARSQLPQHVFRIIDDGYAYPIAPCILFYTVLLHVSDDALIPLIQEVVHDRSRVVIAEVMDSRWRREGNPPVFNRDSEFYIFMMQELGFKLVFADKTAYARYDCEPWNVGRDSRLTTLAFEPVTSS